ncbi:hypothetical protein FV230_00170 [Methylobacterium sp. WL6]|nr:hypothetical protein FV230_00170 [Methylobacterium sp. WL6]
MLAVSRLEHNLLHVLANKTPQIVDGTRQLFEDPKFEESVRTGTNTPQRIRYRVEQVHKMLVAIAGE